MWKCESEECENVKMWKCGNAKGQSLSMKVAWFILKD